MLNDLNRYLVYVQKSKQLDQDKIIQILNQAKAPEWHEAMVNANNQVFNFFIKNLFVISSFWEFGMVQTHQWSKSCFTTC
jgi:hypothetical protein